MRLQLALDGTLDEGLAVLSRVRPCIDIAEVGTPLIYRDGMAAVSRIRQAYPDITLTADLKIMDAGREEALIAFEAGSDIVTILGVAPDPTIRHATAVAAGLGKAVMADMMQVLDMSVRGRELHQMGCRYLCLHTAYDLQKTNPISGSYLLQLQAELAGIPFAIAGGINLKNIDSVLAIRPEIIIVGSAITRAPDPAEAARALYDRIHSL
ncbi:MAG TPA: 3-hexulose-6-phosphate synthase [Anaerolineae bacterium]|nr:3-hexulose-6-phosphate synthase [Anaerolineae bacterium]